MRFYISLKTQLKILPVEGGYVIGVKHLSVGGTAIHNCVHNDGYVFVVYPTIESAREAAKHIMELRKIPLRNRLEV
jgi:hypothetical protein